MAIVAPMPMASVATAASVNAGAETSLRTAYRRSCRRVSIVYSGGPCPPVTLRGAPSPRSAASFDAQTARLVGRSPGPKGPGLLSGGAICVARADLVPAVDFDFQVAEGAVVSAVDRKSTRLNSSHIPLSR